jgi:hypothetical protein
VKTDSKNKTSGRRSEDIWIISECGNAASDLSAIENAPDDGTLKEYIISDIAY